jgi:YVTN family beta-propeller protein
MKYPRIIFEKCHDSARRRPEPRFPHRLPQPIVVNFLGVCAVLALLAVPGYCQDVQERTPGGGLLSRTAIALNPATGKVYVVESEKGAVAVIDDKTGHATSVKAGSDPVALAINPVTNRIYVANHGSGTVTVLDGKSDKVLASLNVGSLPYSLAVNPATNKIYVSRVYSGEDSIIDGATNTITKIKAGSADAIVVNPELNDVYLMGYEGGTITLLHDGSMSNISMGKMHIWGMTLDGAAATLYVTRIGNADLVAFDTHTHKLTTIAAGSMPCAVAVNNKTGTLYVVNYADESLSIIDAAKQQNITTVSVGHHPQAVAVDETANLVYVANTLDGTVTVIDGATNKVATTLAAGKNPHAIAVAGSAIYVADESEPFFARVDTSGLRKAAP